MALSEKKRPTSNADLQQNLGELSCESSKTGISETSFLYVSAFPNVSISSHAEAAREAAIGFSRAPCCCGFLSTSSRAAISSHASRLQWFPRKVAFPVMPTHLSPESPPTLDRDEQDSLRALSRSPHPYHHQSSELPHPSEHLVARSQGVSLPKPADNDSSQPSPPGAPTFSKESTPASDSGTDADDEHFLKGLPPPKLRPHKGLRGLNEVISGTSTPVLSPAVLHEPVPAAGRKAPHTGNKAESRTILPDAIRRRKILVQRAIEAGIITTLAGMIQANKLLKPALDTWRKGT